MLKEKRKKLSKKQRGFALVASLLVSAAVLILIGALFFRLSSGTKDATVEAQRKAALAVAEEGSSHIMNLIAAENTPAAGKDAASAAARDALKKKDGCAFLLGNDDACAQQTTAAFFADQAVQAEGLTAGAGFAIGAGSLGTGSVKVGPLKAASGEGEFDVESVAGAVDASGAKGYNEIKVQITSYVPNKANPTSVRKFEAIYHRVFPGNLAPTSAPATPTPVATATPTAAPTALPTATPAGKDKGKGKAYGKDKSKGSGKDNGNKNGRGDDDGKGRGR